MPFTNDSTQLVIQSSLVISYRTRELTLLQTTGKSLSRVSQCMRLEYSEQYKRILVLCLYRFGKQKKRDKRNNKNMR